MARKGDWSLEDLEVIAKRPKHLTPSGIVQIDRMLEEVGPFGKVTLVKKDGRYRFIQPMLSIEADL